MTKKQLDTIEKQIVKYLKSQREIMLKSHGHVAAHEKPNNLGAVTEWDLKIENELIQIIKSIDSVACIIGEETGGDVEGDSYWVLDPIDGTESFIRGLPTCFNMVSYIVDHKVEYALVYQFVPDKLFTARRGQGAFMNGKKLSVSKRSLRDSWVVTHAKLKKHPVLIRTLIKECNRICTSIGSMIVAEGGAEGYISEPNGAGGVWDYAPKALILQEAGCLVTNIGSDHYDPNVSTLIAATPTIFDGLHKLVKLSLSSEA